MRKEVDAEEHIRRLAADVVLACVQYNPRNLGGRGSLSGHAGAPATLPYLRMISAHCSLP
jgi:hypothetical protein